VDEPLVGGDPLRGIARVVLDVQVVGDVAALVQLVGGQAHGVRLALAVDGRSPGLAEHHADRHRLVERAVGVRDRVLVLGDLAVVRRSCLVQRHVALPARHQQQRAQTDHCTKPTRQGTPPLRAGTTEVGA
jgi:endonuclease/exonuclease/phosphatase (EEP) superfamily protein YafD